MVRNLIWFFVGVVVAFGCVVWMKGCKESSGDLKKGDVVEVVRVDTVRIREGDYLGVKYVYPDGNLYDSIQVYKVKIDSLEKNRVLVVNEKTVEVIKYVPILDSLGESLKKYLDLKDGDKVMKLPAVVQIQDEESKWLKFRVLIDEKPRFLGGDIVSNLIKKDSLVRENFWMKEWEIRYKQENPYLNKVDIVYKEKMRKYKILKFFKLKK